MKPFSPRTLLARVRALTRRTGAAPPGPLAYGDVVLEVEQQVVRVAGGEPQRLTVLEARLLRELLQKPGRTMAPDQLARAIWGYQGVGDRTRLKQLVHRLRQKIEADPTDARYLVTVPGAGYLLRGAREP